MNTSSEDNKNGITIGFAGDVMIGRLVNEHLYEVPAAYIWGDVLSLLRVNDLNIINLEAALTKSTKRVPKVFNFKADPKHVQTLIEGTIGLVNLANNHVLDFSKDGLIETLETLGKSHIPYVGAGKNANEAADPVILTIGGIRIGILGCTDNEPTWAATEESCGTRYVEIGNLEDLESLKNDIAKVRKQVKVLILSIHWGPNMKERPSKDFIDFAHQLIDCGVDILHGHSAHIFQGVEVYKGKLILYDTGDFVDDYYVDPQLRNDRSFLFLVDLDQNGHLLALRLIPVFISNFQVNLATGKNASESLTRMQSLSKELHTVFVAENGGLVYRFV